MLGLVAFLLLVLPSLAFLTPSSSLVRGQSRPVLNMRWGLKTDEDPLKPKLTADGKTLRDSVPFELRGFSLPAVVFTVGVLLTSSSFLGFFLNNGDGEGAISSIGFIYGIPVFLIGLSLWYAEIPPVEVISDPEGDRVWDLKATDTFRKIKSDVTRHRYGDDAHLDSTLETLGLKLPQKKYPKLLSLTQQATPEGELAFTLTFQSTETPYKLWAEPARVKRWGSLPYDACP